MYIAAGTENKLSKAMQLLSDYQQQDEDITAQLSQVREDVGRLNKKLANLDGAFRNLKDNVVLREKRRLQQLLLAEIQELKNKMGDSNLKQLLREKQKLRAEWDSINMNVNNVKGRKTELVGEINTLQSEVNEPAAKQVCI